MYEKSVIFFEKNLSYNYQYRLRLLGGRNQHFSSHLAKHLTVLLFLGLPLGITKSVHAHMRALNIKSHLRWRKQVETLKQNLISSIPRTVYSTYPTTNDHDY